MPIYGVTQCVDVCAYLWYSPVCECVLSIYGVDQCVNVCAFVTYIVWHSRQVPL